MPWSVKPDRDAMRWHAIGLGGLLIAVTVYAISAAGGPKAHDAFVALAVIVAVTVAATVVGLARGWHRDERLLIAWPFVTLITALAMGLLQIPAFLAGRGEPLEEELPRLLLTVAMWVIVAEVTSNLLARLTEQQRLLRTIAQTDALTGLLNRTSLSQALAEPSAPAALALLDLDDFKQYNDTHGHVEGDELLIAFADALRHGVRPHDTVFRVGGDEFLLLLPDTTAEQASAVVRRLQDDWDAKGYPLRFSAGVASAAPEGLRLADERMYAAKRGARQSATGACAHCADPAAHLAKSPATGSRVAVEQAAGNEPGRQQTP